MADCGFWGRRLPLEPSPHPPKRPRSDYDLTPGASGQERANYFPREDDPSRLNPYLAPGASRLERPNYLPGEDDHAGLQPLRDPTSIGKSYDLYLQNAKKSSVGSVEAGNISGSGLARSVNDGVFDDSFVRIPFRDPIMNQVNMGVSNPGTRGRRVITEGPFVSQVPTDSAILPVVPGQGLLLPPDASNSIFVEGLPRDCTEREVAHIFRPFLGYKETRLVRKEPKHQDGDQKILCFVDFTNIACAMTAMNTLQGYQMDERKLDSPILHLKFSKGPDPKSGHGSRSKR